MPAATTPSTAKNFVKALKALGTPDTIEKVQRFFSHEGNAYARDNKIMGVSIGSIFPIAKKYAQMPLSEIELLLDSAFYEVRMGGMAIMDFQARAKSTPASQRKALFDLYIERHDRINNWDLVDRAAPYVVGGYLMERPRKILYKLAKSKNPWERRTAIVSTYYFIRAGDTHDTFGIAELLVHDDHELVQKAVGSWIREAGKKDRDSLLRFLDKYAATMPKVMLRYSIEKLDAKTKARFTR